MSQPRFWVIAGIIGLAAGLRLVGLPWNIAPMGALSLFAGAHIRDRRWAFAVPLVALLLGDLGLGAIHNNFAFWTFHALMPANYLCYAASVGLGMAVRRTWKGVDAWSAQRDDRWLEAKVRKLLPVAGATLAGGAVFFLVTNFAVWALFPTYPHTWSGLVTCYERALPFYRNTMLSDAFFVAVLFGGFAALEPVLGKSDEADQLDSSRVTP